jgi:hypothetical protein
MTHDPLLKTRHASRDVVASHELWVVGHSFSVISRGGRAGGWKSSSSRHVRSTRRTVFRHQPFELHEKDRLFAEFHGGVAVFLLNERAQMSRQKKERIRQLAISFRSRISEHLAAESSEAIEIRDARCGFVL